MGQLVRDLFIRIVQPAFLKILFASFLLPVYFSSLPAQTPSRIINIKVAFDEELQFHRKWRLTLKRVISASSRKFEKHFGIKLNVIDYENWKSDDSLNRVYDLINDLRKKVLLNDCDIVVGFSGQWTRRDDISGAAIYLRNYALVKRMSSEQVMSLVLTHELCHLFGAIDLNEKGSIMDMKNAGSDFDAFTTRFVLLNRNRNFIPHIFPLERGKWDKVITLYKERKRLEHKEVDINVMLATFYIEKKECDSAIAECLECLEFCPNSAEIHNLLGIAFRRKGEFEGAVDACQMAIELNPDYALAYSNLGYAFLGKGMYEEAKSSAVKVREKRGQNIKIKAHFTFGYFF